MEFLFEIVVLGYVWMFLATVCMMYLRFCTNYKPNLKRRSFFMMIAEWLRFPYIALQYMLGVRRDP